MGVQRMNKKGFEFKSFFFAIIALGMLIVATGVHLASWNTAYDANLTVNLDEFNRMNSITSQVESQQGSLSIDDTDPTSDAEANTYKGAFAVVSGLPSSVKLVYSMIFSATERIGLSESASNYVAQGIVTMIALAVIFAIIAIIFRVPRSTI